MSPITAAARPRPERDSTPGANVPEICHACTPLGGREEWEGEGGEERELYEKGVRCVNYILRVVREIPSRRSVGKVAASEQASTRLTRLGASLSNGVRSDEFLGVR